MDSDSSPAAAPHPRFRAVIRLLLVLGIVASLFWYTGCMERLFYHPTAEPTPVSAAPPHTQSVWFTSADGTRLHGWFIPATQPNAAPAPTILHVHGNAGNILHHAWFTEHLPPAGFNVFLFDYRGYGESHGKAVRRKDLIADTHAALDALLTRDDVDPQRIGMYAQSLGAAVGINVMADRPEIAVAVFESPFASWRSIAANALGGDPPGLAARTIAAVLIHDSHRPDRAITRIVRPMLILHGDADSIIPVSHSRRLADAARGHAQLHELPGGDHNSLRTTHREIDAKVIDFFSTHLR